MLCRSGPICKVKQLNIHVFNECISNERQHIEKSKFVPIKLTIYQLLSKTTKLGIKSILKQSVQIFKSHNLHIYEY